MIVGVNGIRLVGHRSGVGRAIEAFLRNLDRVDHPFSDVRVYTPSPLPDAGCFPAVVRNIVLPSPLPLALWEQFVLLRAHGSRDLLLCPSYVMPLLARCPTLVVHHGSYEGYPQAFSWWTLTKARAIYQLSARRATLVSTVSQHSKQDIVRFYGVRPEKIRVIPDGVDTGLFRPIDDAPGLAAWRRANLGEDVPFLLYVGRPSRRRNLPNLFRAFGRLKRERHLPHKLVLIGTVLAGIPIEPLMGELGELGLDNEIVRVPYASHEDIAVAFNACDVFVYPSSYEGFGMPVLEAMACGTPAIALDNTAFPEFAGGVARLLPDAEVGTLMDAISELLADDAERARMRREGPRRAAEYDWRLVTRRYVDLLEEVARLGAAARG